MLSNQLDERHLRGATVARTLALVCLLLWAGAGCDSRTASGESTAPQAQLTDGRFTPEQVRQIRGLSPLPEPPDDPTNRVSGSDEAAHLGRFLFFDERLSGDGSVSCASCHNPHHGFSVPTRLGFGMGETPRHPPTLLNAAYHEWFNWDGSADSLWAQQAGPLEAPAEHGSSRTAVAKLISRDDQLRRAYEAVFDREVPDLSDDRRFPPVARPVPDRPDSKAHRAWTSMNEEDRSLVNHIFVDVTKTIGAYERRLVTGPAPFDRYVASLDTVAGHSKDPEGRHAISADAKRGLELFIGKARCVTCHNGPLLSDKSFHNLALPARPWFDGPDPGRWLGTPHVKDDPLNATGRFSDSTDGRAAEWIRFLKRTPEDKGQFKTPSLRNVSRTAPYMHGGHFSTLEAVVEFYNTLPGSARIGHREESLRPAGLSGEEVDHLVAFLRSLDGELPDERLMQPPDSPVPPNAQR